MQLLSLVLCGALMQTPPVPAQEKISLPSGIQTPVAPTTPPMPIVLTPNLVFMVAFEKPLILRFEPEGIVSVSTDTGPLRIRSVFVDSLGGLPETRTYTQKYLYTVSPVASGTTVLNVSLAGATDASGDIKRAIAAQTNVPPPTPPTPPVPPTPDPATQALQTALTADVSIWPAGSASAASTAQAIAKIYRTAASTTVNNTTLVTYQDLLVAIKTAQDTAVVPTAIPKLRAAIGIQIEAALGTLLTAPINRALAMQTFNTIAAELEQLK